MANISISAPGLSSGGFLYNNGNNNARLCITAESEEFDMDVIKSWQDEGFDVVYLPYNGGGKDYGRRLQSVKDGLGVGENYGVVAFGDAANYCLDFYINSVNASRLCALVAYYPSLIPDTRSRFPLSLQVVVHLAGESVDVLVQPVALGLQGKKRRQSRPITAGVGTGERLDLAYPAFTYDNAVPGFAESDLEEYDHLSANLAWTRTLKVLRKGYSRDPDLERRVEDHVEGECRASYLAVWSWLMLCSVGKFFSSNVRKTMDGYVRDKTPGVTYTPTISGGIGKKALNHFYEHFFIGKLPPSMRLRLLSRTTGPDRVVDELYVSYEHTQEVPWMLPGVPPTNKRIEIILVSIVSLRGGRIYSEHVYWDQASVLVQVGLLDPKLLPNGVQGVDRLPVVGREAARRILHEDNELEQEDYHNKMIKRARARARRNQNMSSRASQADESGAELKSEAEQTLPDRSRNKGKSVQRPRPAEQEDEGAETETESSVKGKSNGGGQSASVEDGTESGGNGTQS
ncbi:unnamed protein product [Penicillium salamii]|uniref:Dienelactone hydrolase n=1 Tax=Penicillium salamii TaxID=1612424 RepID=A0A9W4K0Q2_9EURO|nr:unnamed protein product [Penicillium salamii]CAG8027655.1 unnamed protein product [Penicillium salamii]CAG8062599.1 unnamed protein product [Penicillium salamii]CAG8080453.1 unnamed protein product [Penicillium salamii]CAG8187100.1 unnamed protein product [Penicillium salamii]